MKKQKTFQEMQDEKYANEERRRHLRMIREMKTEKKEEKKNHVRDII